LFPGVLTRARSAAVRERTRERWPRPWYRCLSADGYCRTDVVGFAAGAPGSIRWSRRHRGLTAPGSLEARL